LQPDIVFVGDVKLIAADMFLIAVLVDRLEEPRVGGLDGSLLL